MIAKIVELFFHTWPWLGMILWNLNKINYNIGMIKAKL